MFTHKSCYRWRKSIKLFSYKNTCVLSIVLFAFLREIRFQTQSNQWTWFNHVTVFNMEVKKWFEKVVCTECNLSDIFSANWFRYRWVNELRLLCIGHKYHSYLINVCTKSQSVVSYKFVNEKLCEGDW